MAPNNGCHAPSRCNGGNEPSRQADRRVVCRKSSARNDRLRAGRFVIGSAVGLVSDCFGDCYSDCVLIPLCCPIGLPSAGIAFTASLEAHRMSTPTTDLQTVRVTFVCMANYCRSPTSHGVFRDKVRQAGLADRIAVSSAGTHAYHIGSPPDPRSQAHALKRGYDLSDLRARRLIADDFLRSELVLVMDWDNLVVAEEVCPASHRKRLRRLTEFGQRFDSPVVPDPYGGGADGFEHVLDLVEDACDGLLTHLRQRIGG